MTAAAMRAPSSRPPWRAVAIPNEHGGWGLTAEPVLLGLLVAPSLAGLCLAAAALLAFLVRTPLKLLSIDLRHQRWSERSRLAVRIAIGELLALVLLGAATVLVAGWAWMVPVALAVPLVALEWYFDARGRGRRLTPELAGAVGIAAVAAAIVVAGDEPAALAAGLWLVLTARAIGSIPFVRVQIARLRRGSGDVLRSDLAQVAAVIVAAVAVALDRALLAGWVGVVVLAVAQAWWVRRPPVPAKRLGLAQMGLGLGLVVVTALGVIAA